MAMMGNGQSENDQQSGLDDDVIPEEWLEEIQRRKKLVSEACQKYKTEKTPLTKEWIEEIGSHLIVEDQYKIIYCRVPKSGNTSWKRLLLALSGIINDTSMAHGKKGLNPREGVNRYLHTLNTLSFSEAKQKLETHLKVMYLRHPLERLLSAYRNKLERDPWTHVSVSSQVVPYVMKHYRGVEPILPVSVSQRRGRISGVFPSGEEFSFPKDELPSWVPKITFEEFLRYVGDNPNFLNGHWAPPNDLCHPCVIQYDVIGYFGTISEDANNILKLVHAYPAFKFPNVYINLETTSNLVNRYYSNVSKSTLQKIRPIYALDAAMSASKLRI
ncbi:carbohydrate sulfotransferase 11 [Lingula anatina]|uniref:Carbohydrate sulfotransferase n=1 Tax=Lingula anatina TaxID=7574 RepID=A0A1S3HWS1_LINAN|nr:carbohydrate sulfotransferase 11 [Lingula anatina]|eukprot:XP_013389509.1 carbohydrate sulfotransferase 11 [Lingula anatina]